MTDAFLNLKKLSLLSNGLSLLKEKMEMSGKETAN
jgi:hypothetical protein